MKVTYDIIRVDGDVEVTEDVPQSDLMLLEVPLRGAEVRMLVRYSRPLAAIVVLRVLTCSVFGTLAVGLLFNF